MKHNLYRSRNGFAQISWEMVAELGGDVVAAAIFDWVAWRSEGPQAVTDGDGRGWFVAGRKDISEETNISEKAARNALAKLVEEGHLERTELRLQGNYDRTSAYSPIWSHGDEPLAPGGHSSGPTGPITLAPGGQSSSIEDIEDSSLSSEADATDEETVRDDVESLCTQLRDAVIANGNRPPTITGRWRDAARMLLDRDRIPLEQARHVLAWSQQDQFWRSNILSMPKFREKFDQLRSRSEVDSPSGLSARNAQNFALVEKLRQRESSTAGISS